MVIGIENLIDEATLAALRGWMSEVTFEDDRPTAEQGLRIYGAQ